MIVAPCMRALCVMAVSSCNMVVLHTSCCCIASLVAWNMCAAGLTGVDTKERYIWSGSGGAVTTAAAYGADCCTACPSCTGIVPTQCSTSGWLCATDLHAFDCIAGLNAFLAGWRVVHATAAV
jgi:hypothetical protein